MLTPRMLRKDKWMKEKNIATGSVLLLLIIVIFWGRKNSNNDQADNMRKIMVLDKIIQNGIVSFSQMYIIMLKFLDFTAFPQDSKLNLLPIYYF